MEDYLIISICTDRSTSSEEKRCFGRLMMRWLSQVQKLELTTITQKMIGGDYDNVHCYICLSCYLDNTSNPHCTIS